MCGAAFNVQALDKRTLHVATEKEIIKPGDWKCIQARLLAAAQMVLLEFAVFVSQLNKPGCRLQIGADQLGELVS